MDQPVIYGDNVFSAVAGEECMRTGTLADIEQGRDNNLNFIRILAAFGVLVSHAWPVSTGHITQQPLVDVLNGIDLGIVCVSIFFTISGYLIARSFDRNPNIKRFWLARILRIFPGLLIALLLTVFILAPLVTTASYEALWRAAPEYILRNFTLFSLDQSLPGVFKSNPVGGVINIPLWTLSHELVCYMSVVVFGIVGALKNPRLMFLVCLVFIAVYGLVLYYEPQQRLVALAKLAFPFMIGIIFYVWRQTLRLNWMIGGALIFLAIAFHGAPFFREVFMVALGYAVFLVAYLPRGLIREYNKVGDYSYGVYIYAFPLQQLIASFGITNPFLNILYTLPLVLICAFFSWTFIEKPAIGLTRHPRPLGNP